MYDLYFFFLEEKYLRFYIIKGLNIIELLKWGWEMGLGVSLSRSVL